MSLLIGSLFASDDFFQSTVGKNEHNCNRETLVRVYRNLNKPEFYSILAKTGQNKGKVVGYAKSVRLIHAKTIVSEKSRQRVLKEGRKNVHAFCEGIIIDASNVIQDVDDKKIITYSPYKMGSFYDRLTEDPISMTNADITLQGANVYTNDYFISANQS